MSAPELSDLKPEYAGSFKELFAVSLPLIISAGSHSLMNVADRVMLAGYSPADASSGTALDVIAAVTPAGMLLWTVAYIPLGTILYANTFIAQFDGAGNPRKLVESFWHAVWLSIVSGLLLVLLLPLSGALFRFAGHSESVVGQEVAYFNTLCGGSVLLLLSTALSCFFSGRQKTNIVMYVTVISLLVNVVFDYLLIYGCWGIPPLGITGAAIATLLARTCDVGLFGFLIWKESRRGEYPLVSAWRLDWELLTKYLKYGVPSGLHYFVDNSGFLFFLLIVGSLNRDALAATSLAFSVNGMIFIPLLGFGTAVQTLVGHHLGAGLPAAASRTTWNAIRMSIVWTGTAAVLLVFFPTFSLLPFLAFAGDAPADTGSVEAVLPLAAGLLKFVAIYSIFDAMAVVFASALRGAGDTIFPMIVTMFSSWLVMTMPAWLLVQSETVTIQHLWMTCTAHILLMGTAMLFRFRSGKWKLIQIADDNSNSL